MSLWLVWAASSAHAGAPNTSPNTSSSSALEAQLASLGPKGRCLAWGACASPKQPAQINRLASGWCRRWTLLCGAQWSVVVGCWLLVATGGRAASVGAQWSENIASIICSAGQLLLEAWPVASGATGEPLPWAQWAKCLASSWRQAAATARKRASQEGELVLRTRASLQLSSDNERC